MLSPPQAFCHRIYSLSLPLFYVPLSLLQLSLCSLNQFPFSILSVSSIYFLFFCQFPSSFISLIILLPSGIQMSQRTVIGLYFLRNLSSNHNVLPRKLSPLIHAILTQLHFQILGLSADKPILPMHSMVLTYRKHCLVYGNSQIETCLRNCVTFCLLWYSAAEP